MQNRVLLVCDRHDGGGLHGDVALAQAGQIPAPRPLRLARLASGRFLRTACQANVGAALRAYAHFYPQGGPQLLGASLAGARSAQLVRVARRFYVRLGGE
jgi:hypothetical protein